MYAVGPDHFRTMGIQILRGRGFTPQDNENSHLVTVVDEELGRIVFPGQDPIGKHIRVFGRSVEIVGIARHIKHSGLDTDSTDKVQAQFYFPITQLPERILGLLANAVAGIVRSRTAPAALMSSIRHELDTFDSGQAVTGDRLMVDIIAGSLAQRRFSLIVLAAFATTALVLSLVGVYGVISYLVSQRTKEIGVRIALGARPRTILADILKYGATLGTIGVILGALGAAALSRLISSLLFGVSPTDLKTFGLAAILLFTLTIAACLIPARRAVQIDPMLACKYE
jgi:ABC-type antimicrobial peptide transport system permease subunit